MLGFGVGVTITEDVAKNAFAESYKTTEDKVNVTITALRRLHGPSFPGRHLAAGTDVKARIRTDNAEEADRMNTIGANTTTFEKDFNNNYEAASREIYAADIVLPVPTAQTPMLKMEVSYVITSTTGTVVVPPSVSAIQNALILEDAGSFANSVEVSNVARTLTPTLAPTRPAPQKTPTPIPTARQQAGAPLKKSPYFSEWNVLIQIC